MFRLFKYILFLVIIQFFSCGVLFAQSSGEEIVRTLTHLNDRSSGLPGNTRAARYIEDYFENLGFSTEKHLFFHPTKEAGNGQLHLGDQNITLQPFHYNAITPQAIDGDISGPLYYVNAGTLKDLEGNQIKDSIILMDFDSGINWQNVASLGAKALIFRNKKEIQDKFLFQEKREISPIRFPVFWLQEEQAVSLLNNRVNENNLVHQAIRITYSEKWKEHLLENIYAIIPGNDPDLQDQLLIFEAFFDNSSYLPGQSPGADEAVSIATLLQTAAMFKKNPPGRTVLLLATNGHANALAGMREFIWSIKAKSKEIKKEKKHLKKAVSEAEKSVEILETIDFPLQQNQERDELLKEAVNLSLKEEVDRISRKLVSLRLNKKESISEQTIKKYVDTRFSLRQLGWAEGYDTLTPKETELLKNLIPASLKKHKLISVQGKKQLKALKSTSKIRKLIQPYTIEGIVSLHLSSHGSGIGGFHRGWMYQLKPTVNRTGIYSWINRILRQSAAAQNNFPYVESLSGDQLRSWDTWFLDKPFHGGEVSSLAGYLGITLATVGDARSLWGTPWDTMDRMDLANYRSQEKLILHLAKNLSHTPKLKTGKLPRNGFATVTGRANLLLQGELFANYPAQQSVITGFQGKGLYNAMVDSTGTFRIRGIADKKNVVDKLIIEGYRFDDQTGRTIWAIDKKETGKKNYRLKIRRKNMKTDLTFFSCKETTIFDLLEPRNFRYLTKLEILDGRRDAPPQHFWYSRIDTRLSTIATIFTEPDTWLKLTLSDSVLTRKLILSNSNERSANGYGYPVNQYPIIPNTSYFAAKDIWMILAPRIKNLEKHGINDPQVNNLKTRGIAALANATAALEKFDYATFRESALKSLSLAGRVYVQVDKTQKDVLFGVLFYIALFVPFAFCIERFLFNYTNIYKRIVAFLVLLCILIFVIYSVHPAFQLAYSPMVVILAFFIIGLSLMVTLIIFFRFEEEMILLQRHASNKRPTEISQWKAFVAAFFLGVSNLRRRKLRTMLTCLTLIILTFTIMSFTSVKSSQKPNRLLFQEKSPYAGLLLKNLNWVSMPRQAAHLLSNRLQSYKAAAIRVWLEGKNTTQPMVTPLSSPTATVDIKGLIGLTPDEDRVTAISTILTSGRWMRQGENRVILLEKNIASRLGITQSAKNQSLELWGMKFKVIGTFDGKALDTIRDLDGEPLTPVTFPQEVSSQLSEVEQEALESGDDVRSMQSRYRHISGNQVAIIPAKTLLSYGGKLKSISILPGNETEIDSFAESLVERFSLPLFVGKDTGVFFFSPSNTLSYSGVPNILIPLLISVFIVLNTMISSVYERRSEIGVYTSVGLAPTHVSFLFVAEAMALAVISVVLGYLLAQVSAALFSGTSLWEGITVNYSSLAGVAAMILVIGVVLISVIYPSRVAAKIAIPDVNQTFALPAPVNNRIEVMLPFLMKYDENESIGGFIYDYLKGHQDVSHGLFSTGPVEVVFSCTTVAEIQQLILHADDPSALHCTHIRAKVWLAPFDFGIMQEVDIQFCPARESSEYLEIKITLARNAGEVSMWQRVNTLFLHDIRKQLLIWRSMDSEEHQLHREQLLTVIEEQKQSKPVNQVYA